MRVIFFGIFFFILFSLTVRIFFLFMEDVSNHFYAPSFFFLSRCLSLSLSPLFLATQSTGDPRQTLISFDLPDGRSHHFFFEVSNECDDRRRCARQVQCFLFICWCHFFFFSWLWYLCSNSCDLLVVSLSGTWNDNKRCYTTRVTSHKSVVHH